MFLNSSGPMDDLSAAVVVSNLSLFLGQLVVFYSCFLNIPYSSVVYSRGTGSILRISPGTVSSPSHMSNRIVDASSSAVPVSSEGFFCVVTVHFLKTADYTLGFRPYRFLQGYYSVSRTVTWAHYST